jgi:hypothetical protein
VEQEDPPGAGLIAYGTPGIHEVLRRSGLMETSRCLDPRGTLSPGQDAEIDRVTAAYPHARDDDFVRENLNRRLS